MDLFLALYPALMFQRMGFSPRKKIVLSVMLSVPPSRRDGDPTQFSDSMVHTTFLTP